MSILDYVVRDQSFSRCWGRREIILTQNLTNQFQSEKFMSRYIFFTQPKENEYRITIIIFEKSKMVCCKRTNDSSNDENTDVIDIWVTNCHRAQNYGR